MDHFYVMGSLNTWMVAVLIFDKTKECPDNAAIIQQTFQSKATFPWINIR